MTLLLFLLLVNCMVRTAIGDEDIKLVNNGYQNVVIRIAEDVRQDEQLINKIKEAFTEGSAFLYKATRNRAYFANITIAIPHTWQWSNVIRVGERPEKDHILIRNSSINLPFVSRPRNDKCGVPGGTMKFSTQFFFSDKLLEDTGGYARVIVHEWGHLRFGVYDEYPAEAPRFYTDRDNNIHPIRCSRQIKGKQYKKRSNRCIGTHDPDCYFIDDILYNESGYGSLMYKQWLPQITEFCESSGGNAKTEHNGVPRTKQNVLCQDRSVWQVLSDHDDFREDRNPGKSGLNTTPVFNIIHLYKPKLPTSVLVVDVSGSMSGKLLGVRQAIAIYLEAYENGGKLAIVLFNSNSHISLNMITVDTAIKEMILKTLPTTAGGGTSIAAGIRTALGLLKNGNTYEGEIAVMTDGNENTEPMLLDIWSEVINSGVRIHAYTISTKADLLISRLSRETKGIQNTINHWASTALTDAFRDLARRQNSSPDLRRITITSVAFVLREVPYIGSVFMDKTIGNSTQFTISHSGTTLTISVTSPRGVMYYPEYNSVLKQYTVSLPQPALIGKWLYRISVPSSSSSPTEVSVIVSSLRRNEVDPILVDAQWRYNNIDQNHNNDDKQIAYVVVGKGDAPILRANVTIIVERPASEDVVLYPKDNGAGADNFINDGIYSVFFFQFVTLPSISLTRYNLKAIVYGDNGTVLSPSRIIGIGAHMSSPVPNVTPDEPTGAFQRVATGGSFDYNTSTPTYYPPEKINDLEVIYVTAAEREVTMKWTASGDQADQGTATSYDIRFSVDYDLFQTNFSHGNPATLNYKPKPAGEPEIISIVIPGKDKEAYLIAMRVNGTHGLSKISNYVYASMKEHPRYIGETESTTSSKPSTLHLSTGTTVPTSTATSTLHLRTGRTVPTSTELSPDDVTTPPKDVETEIKKTEGLPQTSIILIASFLVAALVVGVTVFVVCRWRHKKIYKYNVKEQCVYDNKVYSA